MNNCYVCSSKATHAVHLGIWRVVCEFHYNEALEEEADGIWCRTIENHREVEKVGKQSEVA